MFTSASLRFLKRHNDIETVNLYLLIKPQYEIAYLVFFCDQSKIKLKAAFDSVT